MKKKILVLVSTVMLLVAGISISRAAFPVASPSATPTTISNGNSSGETVTASDETMSPTTPKPTPAHPAGSKGKSQIAAALLCFFLGGIGIHRFYLGYTWQGVVQLLTGGGCGIWALIDFIRILTGDLGPKGGRYAKTF